MQIVEQIFCVVMGFVFLRVAYRWLDKPDKLGQAFLFFLVAIGVAYVVVAKRRPTFPSRN